MADQPFWNPADKDPDCTLSNSDRTSVQAAQGGVRSTNSVSSGKWYVLATCDSGGNSNNWVYGVATSAALITSALTGQATAWLKRGNTTKINNGVSASYGNAVVNGDVVMLAYDGDTDKVWTGANGTWYSSGDPAAGTGEMYASVSGSIFLIFGSANSSRGLTLLTLADANYTTYPPPSGFTAGWGSTSIAGTASITEANDSVSGAGNLPIVGTASKTEANDSLSGAGRLPVVGTFSRTEASDSLTTAGNFFANATLSVTEASDSLSAAGNLPIVGALSKTEADDSISAAGNLPIVGTFAATEASDSITADGLLPIVGVFSQTEASDSLTGEGILPIVGTASITEDDDSLEANDYVPRGRLDVTEDGDHLLAAGWIPPEWMAAQALKGDRPNWNLCARCNVSIRPNELHKQMEHMGPRKGWTGLYVCWRCLDKPNPQGRPLTLDGDPKPVANPRPLHPT